MAYVFLIPGVLILVFAILRTANCLGRRRFTGQLLISLLLFIPAVFLITLGSIRLLRPQTKPPVKTEAGSTLSTTLSTSAETEPTEVTTQAITGWQNVDGATYYYLESGEPAQGWLTLDGKTYYFLENGRMATGQISIEGKDHFFTADGQEFLLVNPWNPVPEGYKPDLVELGSAYSTDCTVDRACYEDLIAMMDACNAECPSVCVLSGYRSIQLQADNFNRRMEGLISQGYSQAEAYTETARVIAVPGTSEHHLGLAIDIIDTREWSLEVTQAQLPAQQWLMENSWRYGFLLRYPADKTEVTGIIYEPWHYRYVGPELAAQIFPTGLTLEEYFLSITP